MQTDSHSINSDGEQFLVHFIEAQKLAIVIGPLDPNPNSSGAVGRIAEIPSATLGDALASATISIKKFQAEERFRELYNGLASQGFIIEITKHWPDPKDPSRSEFQCEIFLPGGQGRASVGFGRNKLEALKDAEALIGQANQ